MYAEHAGNLHYVSARDGGRVALLAGPFRTRPEAAAVEEAVRRRVAAMSGPIVFAGIGTCRITLTPGATPPQGKLNADLGLQCDLPAASGVRAVASSTPDS